MRSEGQQMTDPKDSNLSPIGRKWDNTPAPPNSEWSVERAGLFGLGIAGVLLLTHILVGALTGQQKSSDDLISLAVKLGIIPVSMVIGALIRNHSKAGPPPDEY
jgi:hypothetical protein